MSFRQFTLLLIVFIGLGRFAGPSSAAGTVQLELVGDAQGSAMAFQQWAQVLGKAGIRNVRIRAAKPSDQVGIETQYAGETPIYIVTGMVRSSNELVLPGRRFRRGDVNRLAQWLKDLAERGPDAAPEPKAPFGLAAAQYEKVRDDLATPVGFPTQGMTRQQALRQIAGRLKLPLRLDSQVVAALPEAPIAEELTHLSCGTTLAYLLGSAGYGLLPRGSDSELAYTLVEVQEDMPTWPIGCPLKEPVRQSIPTLFESLNVNIQNVSAAAALDAIGKRLNTPVLIDRDALSKHGIDPAEVKVSLPHGRTTYSLALRRLLFQARMKFEVRCDEAGTPFLWITSVKPG